MEKTEKALIAQANAIYKENFENTTCFERAIFFSWSCAIKDCGFCYMSTQEKKNKSDDDKSVRSREAMYAEALLCKKFGWELGFFSGGILAYTFPELLEMVKVINKIYGEKVWINIGALPPKVIDLFKDDAAGVVGSLETVNWELHKKVCPSKPYLPYLKMFEHAYKVGLKTAMTFIVGLGETKEDFANLKDIIEKYHIQKIHMYGLIPHPGTMYAHAQPPTAEEQAWWIAKTRIAFPKIDIQCGIWTDRIDRVSILLQAGANTISKFPIIRRFNSPEARELEAQVKKAGREIKGTLTQMRTVDWDAEINKLYFLDDKMKEKIKAKVTIYLKQMERGSKSIAVVDVES